MRTNELILYRYMEHEDLLRDMTFLIDNADNDYYNKEAAIDENTSKSEFIIRKHRNGPTSTINLIFKRDTSTFVNFIDKEES